jgi:hypothetical protein
MFRDLHAATFKSTAQSHTGLHRRRSVHTRNYPYFKVRRMSVFVCWYISGRAGNQAAIFHVIRQHSQRHHKLRVFLGRIKGKVLFFENQHIFSSNHVAFRLVTDHVLDRHVVITRKQHGFFG